MKDIKDIRKTLKDSPTVELEAVLSRPLYHLKCSADSWGSCYTREQYPPDHVSRETSSSRLDLDEKEQGWVLRDGTRKKK